MISDNFQNTHPTVKICEKMTKELTPQKKLANQIKSLLAQHHIKTTDFIDILYAVLEQERSIDDADDHAWEKLYNRFRQNISKPPKNFRILHKYMEILQIHLRESKKEIFLPVIEPEFDNEIDQLRYNKIMEKINNMDE